MPETKNSFNSLVEGLYPGPLLRSIILLLAQNYVYNDTYARTHVPPVSLPLPRNFSFIYLESGTLR